jgi:poly(A) polymerase
MVTHTSSERPIGKLPPQSWFVAPETKRLVAALTSEGAEVRFIGGCVRDSLMKSLVKEKSYQSVLKEQDIDIATPESPETVVRLLENAGIEVYNTGIKYGTISAHISNMKFEITTLRRDIETNGRKAVVAFTNDWVVDAERRDFTINALSVTLEGDLYDSFNGLSDLSRGLVRFIGVADERLTEDVLRILRYFRFYGLFSRLPADRDALKACSRHSKKLSNLSGERIWNEMSKILLTPEPGNVAELMSNNGIFKYILPEAKNFRRITKVGWLENKLSKQLTIRPDPLRRLAALIDTNPKGAEELSKRWRLSNLEALRLITMVSSTLSIDPDINLIDLKRALHTLGSKMMSDLTLLAWSEELVNTPQHKNRRINEWIGILEKCENWIDIKFPLNGNDVVALGFEEGPSVGILLSKVRDKWEKGGYIDGRETCLEYLAFEARDIQI